MRKFRRQSEKSNHEDSKIFEIEIRNDYVNDPFM